jgi:hypothetical protein
VEFVDAKRRTLRLLKVKSSSKSAAALQYHFVDEHGFSRTCPVKPANITALDSQDEKMPLDKDTQGDRPSRKRKSSSCTRALEWMPSQSFHDTPVSPGEPSLVLYRDLQVRPCTFLAQHHV